MTKDDAPIFFLTGADEYGPLARPRACYYDQRLRDKVRDDYILVRVDPPLIDTDISPSHITSVALSTRFAGFALFPLNKWPADVYVTLINDPEILATGIIVPEGALLIAWAVVLPTLKAATEFALKWEPELFGKDFDRHEPT